MIRNHAKSIKKDEIMMCGFVSIICADILNGNEISAILAMFIQSIVRKRDHCNFFT